MVRGWHRQGAGACGLPPFRPAGSSDPAATPRQALEVSQRKTKKLGFRLRCDRHCSTATTDCGQQRRRKVRRRGVAADVASHVRRNPLGTQRSVIPLLVTSCPGNPGSRARPVNSGNSNTGVCWDRKSTSVHAFCTVGSITRLLSLLNNPKGEQQKKGGTHAGADPGADSGRGGHAGALAVPGAL